MIGTVNFVHQKGALKQMYRHSHSVLGLAALSGGALHTGSVNLIWATVLAATVVGAAITVSHIALGLGLTHPHRVVGGLRRHFSDDDTGENTYPATT
jgi:hypothetical protein